MFFQRFRKNRIEEVINKVGRIDLIKRYVLLAIGCFILALAFNLFFLRYDIVCFGVSGLSIVVKEFGVSPSLFILCANVILLVISYFALSWEKTKNSIVGSLLFPVFTWITGYLDTFISFDGVDMLVIAIFGAVISGIGYGFIYKTGFTTGGTDIVVQIVSKYTKVSVGKAMIMVDGLVVLSGKLVFSWEIVLYGFIILYIMSILTDKVILGISESKAFYIVTNKESEVREYLLKYVHSGLTLLSVKGGYSNEKQSMLLTVVSNRNYFLVKEGVKEIDDKAFFLVCDAYEVSNRGGSYE